MDKSKNQKDLYTDATTIKESFKSLSYEAQIAMNAKVELLQELELIGELKSRQNESTG